MFNLCVSVSDEAGVPAEPSHNIEGEDSIQLPHEVLGRNAAAAGRGDAAAGREDLKTSTCEQIQDTELSLDEGYDTLLPPVSQCYR